MSQVIHCRACGQPFPPTTWHRTAAGDIYSVSPDGYVWSHALGRLPKLVDELPDEASQVPWAELEPTGPMWRKEVGAIGYGGWVWSGDGWGATHLLPTDRGREQLHERLHVAKGVEQRRRLEAAAATPAEPGRQWVRVCAEQLLQELYGAACDDGDTCTTRLQPPVVGVQLGLF
jgi:hypothetical protein